LRELDGQVAGLRQIKDAIAALTPAERKDLAAWLREQDRPKKAPRPAPKPRIRTGLRGAVAGTLIGLLAFAAAEGFLFRSGWYSKYLEPNSTTGTVEYNMFWLRRALPPKVPDVLVVGDSRIAEGFSANTATAAAGGKVHFTNLGMPGTSPRVWYYALRDLDRDHNRFSAIAIAFDRYSDFNGAQVVANQVADLNYLAGRLRLTDCWDFSRSFTRKDLQRKMLTGCLIRGLTLRDDVLAFLSDIPGRLARTKDWRNNGASYVAGYGGKPEELTGLTFDAATKNIHFPPGLKSWQTETVTSTLMQDVWPQTGEITAYRTKWLGRILDLYKNSPTRIVFFQLPNSPLPIPEPPEPARFIESVKLRPRLTILPRDTFRDLERPEWFADGLHLNHAGRQVFSEKLARAAAPVVEAR